MEELENVLLVQWFWIRRFWKFVKTISLCCYYLMNTCRSDFPWKRKWPFIWIILNSPNPKKSLVETTRVVLGERLIKILNCVKEFSLCRFYVQLKKTGLTLHSRHPRMVCLVEINPVVLVKKIFTSRQCIFTTLLLSHFRKAWPIVWTILNPLHLRIHCAKYKSNRYYIWCSFANVIALYSLLHKRILLNWEETQSN